MSVSRAERVPAPVLVVGGIVSVQFGAGVARTLFDDLGASGITLLRLALAAVFLSVVLRPGFRRWSFVQWRAAVLLGAAMGGMNLVFYQAIERVPLGIAVTVEFTGPLLLALVQTRRWRDVLWVVLAGVGVLLLGLDTSGGVPLTGLLLAFLAGLLWATYIVCSAGVGKVLPGIDGLAGALLVASLIALPFGAGGAAGAFTDPKLFLGAAAVALLSSVLPYGLELSALRRIPTRVFGVLMSLEPAAAALAGLLVLGQALGVREVAAIVLVSAASAGITLAGRGSDGGAVVSGPAPA